MLDLMVREVFANIYYKGKENKGQIKNVHQNKGCMYRYKLGKKSCGKVPNSCRGCFDLRMSDKEMRFK